MIIIINERKSLKQKIDLSTDGLGGWEFNFVHLNCKIMIEQKLYLNIDKGEKNV